MADRLVEIWDFVAHAGMYICSPMVSRGVVFCRVILTYFEVGFGGDRCLVPMGDILFLIHEHVKYDVTGAGITIYAFLAEGGTFALQISWASVATLRTRYITIS